MGGTTLTRTGPHHGGCMGLVTIYRFEPHSPGMRMEAPPRRILPCCPTGPRLYHSHTVDAEAPGVRAAGRYYGLGCCRGGLEDRQHWQRLKREQPDLPLAGGGCGEESLGGCGKHQMTSFSQMQQQ